MLSITPAYAQMKNEEGGRVGRTLAEFKADIDKPLAALLTLNTIAHTVGAIGVGAQATVIWGASWISTILVPTVMTLAILLLSEIIPKTIGANHWQKLTPFTVSSLRVVIRVLGLFVYLSQFITRSLKKDKQASVLSRAEFTQMADLGSKQGVIEESESRILKNVLRFDKILAKDVMTPRTVVFAVDESTGIRAFHDANPHLKFSRIPVFSGTIDNIVGYVLKDHMLVRLVELLQSHSSESDPDVPIGELQRTLMVSPARQSITRLFDEFIEQREHIAMVVNEYGGIDGVVTMEDVVETMLGLEIVDEFDTVADLQQMARQKWQARARVMGLDIDDDDSPASG